MPTIHRLRKYRFFFFSNEGGEPPHVHVESGGCYAKYWLKPVALAQSIGYNSAELNAIRKIVVAHEDAFFRKWHEHFG
jgi:hypothetical protein